MSEIQDGTISELSDDIARFVRGGDSIEGAVRRIARYGTPAEVLREARTRFERAVGLIRDVRDPFTLVSAETERGYWYDGTKDGDTFWPAVRTRLALDDEARIEVDRSANKIVALLRPPGVEQIRTRGLVLGYVQSGKTTSFTAVMAKAADVGYRMFVVLSGITDNLRTQTQVRLEETLVGDQSARWHMLTDQESDFHLRGNAANLLSHPDQRLLAVVKKNPSRLKRLVDWLSSAGQDALRACPIVLIDDEADQASIDVGSATRRSRINGLITQILDKPKAAYVAYTATPFANLLIDPADERNLYPRDFIVNLKPGSAYFGPERIFGREPLVPEEEGDPSLDGIDVIRTIDEADIALVQPPSGRGAVETWAPGAPDSLRDAIRWFVIATAVRDVRGQGGKHSSMLIHTSMLATAHEKLADVARGLLDELRQSLERRDSDILRNLEAQFADEAERVDPIALDEIPVQWPDVADRLLAVIGRMRVVVDNYRSNERLFYASGEPTCVIAVGGNTLSRGLTLEGLVCSYFVRAASAYDTLLQMGRWFGYRSGYADLARVWMTAELAGWFADLATVEEEIRRDIWQYDLDGEARKPTEAAVRIRTHPDMAITSAAKMRHAVRAEVSYARSRQQTILFERTDAEWLRRNLDATRALVQSMRGDALITQSANRDARPLFQSVPTDLIIGFLREYQFHPAAHAVRADLMIDYIERELSGGHLRTWNVVVMSHPTKTNGAIDLGLGDDVGLIERARLDTGQPARANIKALVSTIDRVADVDVARAEILKDVGTGSDEQLLRLREDVWGDVGLLCIYPISKDSQPRSGAGAARPTSRRRLPMEAVEHLIGVCLFFPHSRGGSVVTYMSADLSSFVIEDVSDELNEIDRADERALAEEDRQSGEEDAGPSRTSVRR